MPSNDPLCVEAPDLDTMKKIIEAHPTGGFGTHPERHVSLQGLAPIEKDCKSQGYTISNGKAKGGGVFYIVGEETSTSSLPTPLLGLPPTMLALPTPMLPPPPMLPRQGEQHFKHHDVRHAGHSAMLPIICLVVMLFGIVWAIRERKRRRAIAPGGSPVRAERYQTRLCACVAEPRLWFPSTCFLPILAAFNRAEADKRECDACDLFFALKTPNTQYHTRQSIRSEHDLENAQCVDCVSSIFCTPCAVAQDTLEMERRQATRVPTPTILTATVVDIPMLVPPPEYNKHDYEQVAAEQVAAQI